MREPVMLVLGTVIGTVIGAVLGWLGRVWADRIQRRELFDHKLRLEKEYQIYTDLWEKVFEFRRDAHAIVDTLLNDTQGDPHQAFCESFNALQAVVRRNEPFIAPKVWEPARAIVSQGWEIASSSQLCDELGKRRDSVQDCKADELLQETEKQKTAIEEVDRLFPLVKDAIRHRITLTTGAD